MAIWWLCTFFCGLRSLSQHVLLSSVMLCFNRIWRDLMGFTVNIWNNPVILSSGGWYHNHIYYSISTCFLHKYFYKPKYHVYIYIYIILLYTAGISSKNPASKNLPRNPLRQSQSRRPRGPQGDSQPDATVSRAELSEAEVSLKKWPY